MDSATITAAPASAIAAVTLADLEAAWNAADGMAFGAPFAEDADFVDIRGTHHQGRGAITYGHQAIFDTIYRGSTVAYRLDTARVAAPGVVVAIASATLDAPTGPLRGVNHARFTLVLTDADGRWAVSSFHNTLVAPH